MASPSLGKETLIYGLGSVLGRLINYLIVPLHTYIFTDNASYGVIAELYAYAAFFNIVLSFSLETSVFRFVHRKEGGQKYLSTMFVFIACLSLLFFFLIVLNVKDILGMLSLSGQASSYYTREMLLLWASILLLDALCVIPFAVLRLKQKAKKFVSIKLLNILTNVALNIFLLAYLPRYITQEGPQIEHVFLANLIASFITFLLLLPLLRQIKLYVDKTILKKILQYSFPLVLAGLFGMINETLDRIFLKWRLPGNVESRLYQIGIYNACYKLSIFMTITIQAIRMGMEPFFFRNYKENTEADANKKYVLVMDYLSCICSIVFLFVISYMPILQYLIGDSYRSGLYIVPILLVANWFLGMYYQNSFWYKVKDQTYWGLLFGLAGVTITLSGNYFFIPLFGFEASAWTTLACYATMFILSLSVGRKIYPLSYKYVNILLYFCISLVLFWAIQYMQNYFSLYTALLLSTVILISYTSLMLYNKWKYLKSLR